MVDLMEALRLIGLDADACRRFGIDIYKVGLVWPIEQTGAAAFMNGKAEILVVEEKNAVSSRNRSGHLPRGWEAVPLA